MLDQRSVYSSYAPYRGATWIRSRPPRSPDVQIASCLSQLGCHRTPLADPEGGAACLLSHRRAIAVMWLPLLVMNMRDPGLLEADVKARGDIYYEYSELPLECSPDGILIKHCAA